MLRNKRKGQSAAEYTVLLIVVMGAFLGIQNYMKRGIQGRWKESVDSLGEQYDPRTMVTNARHTLYTSSNTAIVAVNSIDGYWTQRTDTSATVERKTGNTTAGAY